MERVNFIGHNIQAYWGLIWQVDNHMIVLSRAMLGGMFLKVIDPEGKTVVEWPSTYNMHILSMQVNYLIDQILLGDVSWARKILAKQGFISKIPRELEDDEVLVKKLLATQMVEWVNKVWGTTLDKYENYFPYVHFKDIDVEELLRVWNLIADQQVKDYKNEHKPRKLRKVEKEEEFNEDPDEMYKKATENIDEDHGEWVDKFEELED